MEKEDQLNDKIKQLHVAAEQATEKEAHIDRLKKEVESLKDFGSTPGGLSARGKATSST